jgi:predicted naringenin-chalcone synthase
MHTVLEAIATANPPYRLTQSQAAAFMLKNEGLSSAIKNRIPAIYANSGIDYRYSCLPDYGGELTSFELYPPNWALMPAPSTFERNQKYNLYAPKLSCQAAQQAIAEAKLQPQDITHLVVVSCTGFAAPGVDFYLIKHLGLSPAIARTMIGFMGCHAAFNGLRTADAICKSDAQAKVLLVCVELCTLHFQVANSLETTIINAIFGDGAAAAILTAQPEAQGKLVYTGGDSQWIPDTPDLMNWTVGNTGFLMNLSAQIPDVLAAHLPDYVENLLNRRQLKLSDLDFWAVHPGGRRIVDKIQALFDLSDRQVADSYGVLRDYGNMSSSTILFILQRILKRILESGSSSNSPCHTGLAIAFGPGLSIESCLFSVLK